MIGRLASSARVIRQALPPTPIRHLTNMPFPRTFRQNKIMMFSPGQVYDVVAAVDRYPEFVPWCVRTHLVGPSDVSSQETSALCSQKASAELWEMAAGFKWINDSYVSKVSKVPKSSIRLYKAEAIDANLFLKLDTTWNFSSPDSNQPDACLVDFQIDFEFRTYSYAYIANLFFLEVASKMIEAFEQRCLALYVEGKTLAS